MLVLALLLRVLAPSAQVEASSLPARAQDAAAWLQQAQQAFDELRLDEARVDVDRALRDPGASRTQLAHAYRLQGVIEASLGQAIAAKRAFAHMLVLQPAAVLSEDYAPKIRRSYEAARVSLAGEEGIALQSAAPAELPMGRPAHIALQLNDTLGLVEQINVELQIAGAPVQHRVLDRGDRGLLKLSVADLPARDQPYALTLRVVARNAFGAELASLGEGDPGTQVSIVRELSDPSPWYQHWWVWAGASGVAIALSSAAVVTAVWMWPVDTRPRDIAVVVE